jgi:hypothetical protein
MPSAHAPAAKPFKYRDESAWVIMRNLGIHKEATPDVQGGAAFRPRLQYAVIACVLLVCTVGCGKAGPEVVPVEGMVTFGGGPWPKPGVVNFVVDTPSPGSPNRPTMGLFDTDGRLTVTTYTKGDGLVPGKYNICIECWEIRPEMTSPTPPKSYVPERFRRVQTSGFSVTVEPGQKVVQLNLDVPKK